MIGKMDETLKFAIIFSGAWALFGLIFFIIGIAILNNRKKKEINCTSKTYGKVKNIINRKSRDLDGGYSSSWYPVFEYNIGELKFIKKYAYGSSQSKYAIGQDVEIYYNPENYNEYYIAGDSLPKKLAIFFTVAGICMIMMAIVFAILIPQIK